MPDFAEVHLPTTLRELFLSQLFIKAWYIAGFGPSLNAIRYDKSTVIVWHSDSTIKRFQVVIIEAGDIRVLYNKSYKEVTVNIILF